MADEGGNRGGSGDGVRWETYPAGADLLGMKVESFRRLAFRKGWRRTPGNDGLARVAVPLAEIEQRQTGHPHGTTEAAGDGARGGATPAEPADGLTAELRRRAETAESRAERAEDERDAIAAEVIQERERRARTEGELAGVRIAFEQAQGRAERAEGEAAVLRDAEARAAAQAVTERAAREAAEREREAARGELAELTAGSPLQRALRAFAFRRGRP
jgi:hypothetical protein